MRTSRKNCALAKEKEMCQRRLTKEDMDMLHSQALTFNLLCMTHIVKDLSEPLSKS